MKKSFDYKWVIAALCFLIIFVALGFCSSIKSLYVVPITEALGISRGVFSINDSCRYIATAVVNIFFGSLIAKLGIKKLLAAGFGALIVSTALYAVANNTVVLCLGGVFLGIGLSWTTTTMIGSIVNRWFAEKRGTVMGAILAANGLGGAVATQIVTPIIYRENDPFSYRDAYWLNVVILFATAIVVLIFFRESPEEEIKFSPSSTDIKGKRDVWVGIKLEKALKTKYFYIVAVCIFLTGFILQGITGCAAAHMKDVGIDSSYLGLVVSVSSVSLFIFKFATGALYDKCGLRITASICCVAAVVVMLLLTLTTDSSMGRVCAMAYAVLSAVALPLETIMLPIYAADLFGERSYHEILGIFVSVNTAGYALGAPAVNLCYDILGSYKSAFIISAVVMTAVIVALQFVIGESNRQKEIDRQSCSGDTLAS